jgi:hypothetical protein
MHEFKLDELSQALVSLIKLQRATLKTKIITSQTLLEIFDRFSYELEDENKAIKVANLAETYFQVCSHEVLRKEIDLAAIEERIKSCQKFKAKDLFNILSVTNNK